MDAAAAVLRASECDEVSGGVPRCAVEGSSCYVAFQLVQAAFAALKEPAERAAYDIRSRVPSAAEAKAATPHRRGTRQQEPTRRIS